ncbi:MAG: GFA family protein [Pseudomonadota bacterium]
MPTTGTGRCFCGAVRYQWFRAPLWACHCHCESCRRTCSAPFTSFFGLADDAWSWTGEEPVVFTSSPGVRRSFCGRCGAPMTFAADRFAGETHFYAATMDAPETYVATAHVYMAEKLPWIHLDDGLPQHQGPLE